MVSICSDFIGSFKIGDNVAFNFDIIEELYRCQQEGDNDTKRRLRKPIVILFGSIAEAVLYDLYGRIHGFTREGVPNIPTEVLSDIRTKTVDKFAKFIDNAKSNQLLGEKDEALYEQLHVLRKLRNRVHIQNTDSQFERDDPQAFNPRRQKEAERTLEKLLKTMAEKYNRKKPWATGHVRDFRLPWEAHLSAWEPEGCSNQM